MHNSSPTMKIRHLLLTFDLPLPVYRIRAFRSAMVEWAGRENDLLHNHLNPEYNPNIERGGFKYRYPLVQYRTHKGKAALVALNEGADALGNILSNRQWAIMLDGKPTPLRIADLQMREHTLAYTDTPQRYTLQNWIALNQQNYREYQQIEELIDRAERLENLLAAQIITFARAMDWQIEERFAVTIQQFTSKTVDYHNNKLMAFDVVFDAPLHLPNGIGLGKATSHGFGVVYKAR
jgi:hypothetical protein